MAQAMKLQVFTSGQVGLAPGGVRDVTGPSWMAYQLMAGAGQTYSIRPLLYEDVTAAATEPHWNFYRWPKARSCVREWLPNNPNADGKAASKVATSSQLPIDETQLVPLGGLVTPWQTIIDDGGNDLLQYSYQGQYGKLDEAYYTRSLFPVQLGGPLKGYDAIYASAAKTRDLEARDDSVRCDDPVTDHGFQAALASMTWNEPSPETAYVAYVGTDLLKGLYTQLVSSVKEWRDVP